MHRICWLSNSEVSYINYYLIIYCDFCFNQLSFYRIKDVQNNDDLCASIGLENDDDLFLWNIVFEGPEDTIYEGGYFKSQLKFPEDYPNSPPTMIFKSKMWHPNIYPDGKVCISILHPPGTDSMNEHEKAEERWRPILGVEAILMSVISMLNDPNLESPANLDASLQYRDDIDAYKKKVRMLATKSLEDM